MIGIEAPEELSNDITRDVETPDDSMSEDRTAQVNARVMWSHHIVQGPTRQLTPRSCRTIKSLKHLTCTLAIELQYLKHTGMLDNVK